MEVIIVVASMLIIAAIVWLLNRILPFTLCPVCAAVSGTWLLIQLALESFSRVWRYSVNVCNAAKN